MSMDCQSELDDSPLVDAKGVAHYHTMMTGSLNWAIGALGQHDIQHAVSALSWAHQHQCNVLGGHIGAVMSISSYLQDFDYYYDAAAHDSGASNDGHAEKEFISKLKNWPERTSTFLPSGINLGHYHALIRPHNVPLNTEEGRELEGMQIDLITAHVVLLNYALKFAQR
jgi:hypothetical protein